MLSLCKRRKTAKEAGEKERHAAEETPRNVVGQRVFATLRMHALASSEGNATSATGCKFSGSADTRQRAGSTRGKVRASGRGDGVDNGTVW